MQIKPKCFVGYTTVWRTSGILRRIKCNQLVQKQTSGQHLLVETLIDQGPYVNVAEVGRVVAVGSDGMVEDIEELKMFSHGKTNKMLLNEKQEKCDSIARAAQTSEQATNIQDEEAKSPFRRFWIRSSQQNSIAMWLPAFIAIKTSWPVVVGSALSIISGKRLRRTIPPASQATVR